MTLANMRANGVRMLTASCVNCGRSVDVNVDALPETVTVPRPASASGAASAAARRYRPGRMAYEPAPRHAGLWREGPPRRNGPHPATG